MPVKAIFSDRAIINPEDEQHSIEQFNRSDGINAVSTLIITNDKMCRDGYSRDFRTIQVAHRMELLYELGDALEVNPQNDEKAVSEFLHAYCNDFGDHTLVKLHSFGIDGDISLLGLFTHVLDLFGKPSKHFMQQLATFASDEEERNAMLDPGFLKTATKETGLTITGALLRFKKAVPPLPALLAMIPVVKPRTYSIASAPLASPASIELLVLIDTWWCDEGLRYGLTCNMLRKLKSGDRLWCRIKAGSMERPLPVQSVLCAGIGSGIAPSMAFLRDRVRAAENGEVVAPLSLYFGNRFKKEEYLFQEEFERYNVKYTWFNLHLAFSRDDPTNKVYVQDVRSCERCLSACAVNACRLVLTMCLTRVPTARRKDRRRPPFAARCRWAYVRLREP